MTTRRNHGNGLARGLLLLAIAAATAVSCTRPAGEDRALREVAGGDPEAGRALIRHYGCPACHMIPGIPEAQGLVGPPLIHWSRRIYIAGHLPNNPEMLVSWIEDAPALAARTAMPNVGATQVEARHMAAYLFTLR
jgi:cytochrome c